jgi:hypothetical protein
MLLRLSYLEPCNNRAEFLSVNPPSLIVLPRISFTGDGKTDNVTCAWFVWDFSAQERQVRVVTKAEVAALMSQNDGATQRVSSGYTSGQMEKTRGEVFGNPFKEALAQAQDALQVLRAALNR